MGNRVYGTILRHGFLCKNDYDVFSGHGVCALLYDEKEGRSQRWNDAEKTPGAFVAGTLGSIAP